MAAVLGSKTKIDMNKFRLRTFVEKLIDMDEVEIHDEPVPLCELSRIIEATPKAVLFRKAGPEQVELVSSVAGSRRRLATAFGASIDTVWKEYLKRLESPQPVIDVPSGEAPVHEVIIQGDDVDLSKLPFHPQHELDGSTYITSAIDYSIDPETGRTNVGTRRLSLRNRREAGTNLTHPTDLKRIYSRAAARGERLPLSFAVGSHPLDFMASTARMSSADEVTLVGTLRGEPVPLVKCLTNHIRVPADAEMIIEGYLDERGHCEPEGPYGEYLGYYGAMRNDPVFHVTAITMRHDVLYQSLLHGSGRILDRTDSRNLSALRIEAGTMKLLQSVIAEPVAVHSVTSGGLQNLRVAICQRASGEARKAIHAIFAANAQVKHVFVVDHDVDVFDERQMDWALSTRFQADRDFILIEGLAGVRIDPSLEGRLIGAKAGFDCTVTFGRKETAANTMSVAPVFGGPRRFRTVRQAVETGPIYFVEIMRGLGSEDGREIALALDELRQEGVLCRNSDGQYFLGASKKGITTVLSA